ncbi:MAG TPA: hypothetical protein P5117_14965, partial [Spirochaetia bacterium]|nr:hypothetical protein [Spirochaetia bacterium]
MRMRRTGRGFPGLREGIPAALRDAGTRAAAILRRPGGPVLTAVFAAAGAGLYPAAAAINRFLADRFALPFAVSVLPEELLKLGMAGAAAALARRLGDP